MIAVLVDTTRSEPGSALWTPLRSNLRPVAALAALVAATAHIPVIAPHLAEAPYMGEEFIVLTVACVLLAVAVLVCDSRAVYLLLAATCALALLGYALTRLIAFPQLADDVGNWGEPLGVISISAEAVALLASLLALVGLPRAHAAREDAAATTRGRVLPAIRWGGLTGAGMGLSPSDRSGAEASQV